MTTANPNYRVKYVNYQDVSGTFTPLENLFFCRYSKSLRTIKNCDIVVDGYYCPQSLSGMPRSDCLANKGESHTNWICPVCKSVLKENVTTTLSKQNPDDQNELKRAVFLQCSHCQWTTRDVNLPDHTNIRSSPWTKNTNPHHDYFTNMKYFITSDLEDYLKRQKEHTNLIQTAKEKALKKHLHISDFTAKMSDNPLANILAHQYGSKTSQLDGIKVKNLNFNTISGTKSAKQTFPEEPKFPKFCKQVAEIVNPIEIDYQKDQTDCNFIKNLTNLDEITTLEQRWASPVGQPVKIENLRPIPGPLVPQISLKNEGHRLLKPEYSAQEIQPKIISSANTVVPEIRVLRKYDKSSGKLHLMISNPNYRETNVYLLPFHLKEEIPPGEIKRNGLDLHRISECLSLPTEMITLDGSQSIRDNDNGLVLADGLVTIVKNSARVEITPQLDTMMEEFASNTSQEAKAFKLDWFWLPLRLKFDYTLPTTAAVAAKARKEGKQDIEPEVSWMQVKLLIKVVL